MICQRSHDSAMTTLGAGHGSPNCLRIKYYFPSVELIEVKLKKMAHASNGASKLGLCSSNTLFQKCNYVFTNNKSQIMTKSSVLLRQMPIYTKIQVSKGDFYQNLKKINNPPKPQIQTCSTIRAAVTRSSFYSSLKFKLHHVLLQRLCSITVIFTVCSFILHFSPFVHRNPFCKTYWQSSKV